MAMHTRQAPGAHVSAACLDETAYFLVVMGSLRNTYSYVSWETARTVHTTLPPPPNLLIYPAFALFC